MKTVQSINAPRYRSRLECGFTMVEILAVVLIITLLMSVGVIGFRKSWESQEIKASAMKLSSDLVLASQLAVKLSRPMEVRFYKFRDPGIASPQPQFRAYQIVERDVVTGVVAPRYESQRFEGTTIMSSYKKYSTALFGRSVQRQDSVDPDIGIDDYEYVAVEFLPDGSTNLEPDATEPWTLTLGPVRWLDDPGMTPPTFQCLAIDARTGVVTLY
jgi:uncharacterized protein (TIGR02596 family)